ncbi:hypothetical protein [Frankia sp. QA3]|uniref:hypothetical protein n=1 Tax=Frankia sp. QA3 TaxID=710111 RepID=UPI000269BB9F|nr:hypothetical protein [Frankia sp. QA3]EIV91708.1 hypothetical protein FraQA3DRAFT_1173 [Frankia sp. QA3]
MSSSDVERELWDERELRDAMLAATAQVVAGPDTAAAVRARFRRRRRARRAVAAAVAAVIVVAVPSGLVLARPDGDPVEVRPARPAPSAGPGSGPAVGPVSSAGPTIGPMPPATPNAGSGRADAGGVGVTWLPAGVTFDSAEVGASQNTRGALRYRADYVGMSGGRRSFISVEAQWGTTPTLAAVEATRRAAQPQRTFTPTTVRGQPALFTRMAAKDEFSLIWIERDGLLLEVAGGAPVTTDDVRRVAVGLVPAGPRPATRPAVEQAIRQALTRAFAAGVDPDTALAAIEDGRSLAATRARYLASHPGLARTLRVDVHAVAARDATHAVATITLTFDDPTLIGPAPDRGDPAGTRSYDAGVTVVRTAAGWQVSRNSYCGLAVEACSPTVLRGGSTPGAGRSPSTSSAR